MLYLNTGPSHSNGLRVLLEIAEIKTDQLTSQASDSSQRLPTQGALHAMEV